MLDYNLIIYWEQSLSITLFLLQGKLPVYEYMNKLQHKDCFSGFISG